MIDRYLVRYFLAVIDQGNFSRAAQHCRVSQPTLSIGIAKLETLLARTLFDRTNRRVALTAEGTRFAVHARRIEAEFAEAERAPSPDPGARAPLRLGVVTTLPAARVGAAIRAVAGAPLEIVEARDRDLGALLDRRRVDAIVTASGRADANGLGGRLTRTLFTEGYALAMAADHPLAGRATVAADEVAAETMLVRRQCEALSDVSRFFIARGVRPFMAARTVNDERAIAYVRGGLGVTVVPDCFATDGIATARLAGFDTTRRVAVRTTPDHAGLLEGGTVLMRFADALADHSPAR